MIAPAVVVTAAIIKVPGEPLVYRLAVADFALPYSWTSFPSFVHHQYNQKIAPSKTAGTLFTEYLCLYLDSDKVDTGQTDV